MTHTLVYMALPAYLLVGCVIMLIVNELVHGSVTRKEFVRGMIVWPLGALHFVEHFLSAVIRRARR